MPDPGAGEYSPEAHPPYKPAFSMRLKLDRELAPAEYPGPGHYDMSASTIGNWGAGMAAHQPVEKDLFLAERVEAFARGLTGSPDAQFLAANQAALDAARAPRRQPKALQHVESTAMREQRSRPVPQLLYAASNES